MAEEREKYGTSSEVALSEAEWKKLMATVETLEAELLLKMATTTGLRREDIVSVLIENIDMEKMQLLYYEKKKRRTRKIPLQEEIIKLIKQYLNIHKKKYGKLFPFCGRTAYNILNEHCERAGLGRRPFHALRATCTKFCIKAGWGWLDIAKLTGDKIETLQKHYANPNDNDMLEIVKSKPILPKSQLL